MLKKLNRNYSVMELSLEVGGKAMSKDSIYTVDNVAGIEFADATALSFCNLDAKKHLLKTKAGVVLISQELVQFCPSNVRFIVVDNPRIAFAKLLEKLCPRDHGFFDDRSNAIIAEKCFIHPSAIISSGVIIAKGCKIAANVVVGFGSVLEKNVDIGEGSVISSKVVLHEGVVIGKNCRVHSGAVIGKSGFGFEQDEAGSWCRVPQIGGVILEDDVEIGANSCVDRGALANTIIKKGVKCDNLVQIGHNTIVKEHSLICGCVGISGSVTIGRHCILAGGSMVADHVNIADKSLIAGAAAVRKNIDKPGKYAGDPARPLAYWLRDCVNMASLNKFTKLLKKLENIYG